MFSKHQKKRSSPKSVSLSDQLQVRSKKKTPVLWSKSQQVLHNFPSSIPLEGAIFIFGAKISLKSTKNRVFCILFRPTAGLEPPAPPGYDTGREDQKKGLQLELERFLCPKSLLSVLSFLVYDQLQYVCAQQIYTCAQSLKFV